MGTEFRDAGCGKCDILNQSGGDMNEQIVSDVKKCCRCHEVKPKEQFCKNKSHTDGYDYICKICKYAQSKRIRDKKHMEKESQKQEKATEKSDVVSNDMMCGFDTMNQESLLKLMDKSGVVSEDPIPLEFVETPSKRIVIDFSQYPELFDYVRNMSREEFRSPEMMILYMIRYFQLDWKGYS